MIKERVVDWLTLFLSAGTLICCALPALFVALGAGAVFASLVSHVPQLVWLSENKLLIFSFAGVMLCIGGYMQYYNRNAPCPIDPELARKCMQTRRTSFYVYIGSLVLFLVGGFFAFVAPLLVAE